VVGGANLDVVARAEPLRPGESNPGAVRFGPGGAARNVAENLARLGLRVHLLCAAGSGPLGDLVLGPTRAAGVAVHAVPVREWPDVYVSVTSRGERVWAVSDTAGCEALRPEHLQAVLGECGDAAAVVADANLPEPVLDALRSLAVPRALVAVSRAKAPRLWGALQGAWLLACAASEAAALSGFVVRSREEALSAARWLRGSGCRHALVTLGPQGLVWCGEEEVAVPAPPVQARDPTGAGDAAAACAVAALLLGYPEAEVALLCAWAGALTVQAEGAVDPQIRWEVLCERAGVERRA
jgi:pseudouridine kinase